MCLVADLEEHLFGVEVKSGQLCVSSTVGGCQGVGDPLSIDVSIFPFQQIIKAPIPLILMDWHGDYPVQLVVCLVESVVFIIIDYEFLV